MRKEIEEEFITLFSVSLAIVACAAMVYMVRTPSLTGLVVLDEETSIGIINLLILVSIALLIISLIIFSKLTKELTEHKNALLNYHTGTKKQLSHYIYRARKSGFSDNEIADKLKEHWHESEIKKHLKK